LNLSRPAQDSSNNENFNSRVVSFGAGLHVDYGSSHFWMLVIDGAKDWAIFPAQMSPFLYKGWSQPHFPVNPWCEPIRTESGPVSDDGGFASVNRPVCFAKTSSGQDKR
jgi:hypothetical protein